MLVMNNLTESVEEKLFFKICILSIWDQEFGQNSKGLYFFLFLEITKKKIDNPNNNLIYSTIEQKIHFF